MNDKVKMNFDGELVEVDVCTDEEIETNYKDEDLEKTLDLTNTLEDIEDLEDTMVLEGKIENE